MGDLFIGAYWGPRQESVGQCADRLMVCFELLRDCDEVLSRWFEKGKSPREALGQPVDLLSHEKTLQLLESGRRKRELDRTTIEDLGYRVSLWNGQASTKSANVSICCGIHAENPHLLNSVVFDLPEDLTGLPDRDQCMKILRIFVDTWEPDWAGVISRASRNARPCNPALPFVDWMFYINRVGFDRGKLPAAATAFEIERKGTVVVVQDRPINPASQIDLANVNAVARMFGFND